MARIWRVAFTDSCVQRELVIVEADEVEREKVSEFPRLAQEVLAMQSCKTCEKDWPFEGVLGMKELLKQVDMGSWHATYLNCLFQHRELHAIGLGSDSSPESHFLCTHFFVYLVTNIDRATSMSEDMVFLWLASSWWVGATEMDFLTSANDIGFRLSPFTRWIERVPTRCGNHFSHSTCMGCYI